MQIVGYIRIIPINIFMTDILLIPIWILRTSERGKEGGRVGLYAHKKLQRVIRVP